MTVQIKLLSKVTEQYVPVVLLILPNKVVLPFKRKLLRSTFLWNCLSCFIKFLSLLRPCKKSSSVTIQNKAMYFLVLISIFLFTEKDFLPILNWAHNKIGTLNFHNPCFLISTGEGRYPWRAVGSSAWGRMHAAVQCWNLSKNSHKPD